MKNPRSIVITGASGGLGTALAVAYAEPDVDLALSGRDKERLDATAAQCRDRGARVATAAIDVTEAPALADWLATIDERAPLDLIVANAGISGGTDDAGEGERQARRIFAVNLDGVLNTVLPLIPRLQARGRGQIALMSSLAAFRGLPGAPAYCASKAAVKTWGESLRGTLRSDGIEVSVICPGFIRTAMTASNPYSMPLLMDATSAAAIIKRRLARNHGRIAFPWPMYALVWLLGTLPPAATDPLFARLPEKSRLPEKL